MGTVVRFPIRYRPRKDARGVLEPTDVPRLCDDCDRPLPNVEDLAMSIAPAALGASVVVGVSVHVRCPCDAMYVLTRPVRSEK